MKRFDLVLLFLCSLTIVSAQEKFKFGDCPVELLKMTSYEKDPDASAVVLYENEDVYYEIGETLFDIVTDYVVRIKILSQEGVDYAEGVVGYYKGKTRAQSDDISGLTGWTYNLEGGKVVKEKLSKNYIFTENVSENYERIKFALPSVKVGSVIEYKYTKKSPHFQTLDDCVFQRSIPVRYSVYSVKIPEYVSFNKEVKGYEPISVSSKPVNLTFSYRGNMYQASGEEIVAEVKDLPGLKDEEYVWNYNDFRSRITFEIRRISFIGTYYRDYSQTWKQVVDALNDYEGFGKQFNNRGLFKTELPEVLREMTGDIDSIRAILDLVRSKVKWNDRATLFINNQSKALKEGLGSSGELNALLLNSLRNAGFKAYPVAMSLRSRGRIPMTYPSIENLNYFIVCVYSGENTYYLDATQLYTDLNVIPIDCLVDKALIIMPNGFDWIDLTTVGNNANRINLMLNFNEEGLLTGKKMENNLGEIAYSFKKTYNRADDEKKYIESLESKNDITISDYAVEAKRTPNFSFIEKYDFVKSSVRLEDEIISFNPLLFLAMKNNTFKSEIRKLPVEFSVLYDQRINVMITVPEGYVVDELPISEKIVYEDNQIEFSYVIQQNANIIQLAYRLKLNVCVIPAIQYEHLRDFWSKMYNKENELITIKKL